MRAERARSTDMDPAEVGAFTNTAGIIAKVLQDGWLVAAASLILTVIFFRFWRTAEGRVYNLLEKNNTLAESQKQLAESQRKLAEEQSRLADRTISLMDRIEAKIEGRK